MPRLRLRRLVATAVATTSLLAPLAGASSARADAAAGREKADQLCSTCHGVDGVAQIPNAPNLAGQPEIYLLESLDAYRTGKRQHEMMTVVAKDLTDQDVADLAAWYASIEFSVTLPP